MYLSLGCISDSFGNSNALSSALHRTPEAATVAITSSTALNRFRTLALRVADIRNGFFL